MGLIKALVNSVGGSLGDQWKEYFYCDSLAQNVLMCKGQKQQTQRGTNFRGESNIISNGSVIAVNEGQCALIVEDGKIVELTCEPGRFIYDASTEPSIFVGNFGQSLKDTFKQIGKRFTFGGSTGKDQRVYFINIKPIENNLFGTYTPIPFRFVDKSIGADIDLHVRCRGRFSYTIDNPIVFYTRIAANIQDYISLCSGIALYEDMPDPSSSKIARELLNEERDLYAHFHPVFTAIAPKEKVEAFNALRNDVSSKKISQEDAYLQVVALLDFNINK